MNTNIQETDGRVLIQTDRRKIDIQSTYKQESNTEIVIDEYGIHILLNITNDKEIVLFCTMLSDALVELSRAMTIKKD